MMHDEYPDGPYRPKRWPEWARDEIVGDVTIHFDWTDRLLILLGRTVSVSVRTVVENTPGRCATTSSAWAHRIRWPWQKQPGGYCPMTAALPATAPEAQATGGTDRDRRTWRHVP
jgi:hypothetical protein